MLKTRSLLFSVVVLALVPLGLAAGCSSSASPSGPASETDSGSGMTSDAPVEQPVDSGLVDAADGATSTDTGAGSIEDTGVNAPEGSIPCGTTYCTAPEHCCVSAIGAGCYPKVGLCPG